jgi:hypothetical protein
VSKFDAATVLDALEYDFTRYGGSKGEIPEPSDKQLLAFMKSLAETMQQAFSREAKTPEGNAVRLQVVTDQKPSEIFNALADLTNEEMLENQRPMMEAISKLCSGTPSVEEIFMVPFRRRMLFVAWLLKELNPEAAGAGSTSLPLPPGLRVGA